MRGKQGEEESEEGRARKGEKACEEGRLPGERGEDGRARGEHGKEGRLLLGRQSVARR